MMKKFCFTFVLPIHALLVMVVLLLGAQARAQSVDPTQETRAVVPLYKSMVLNLSGPAARVSIGNPDVADILILRASQLYVLGKDLGTTNVILWDKDDRLIGNVSVEVTHDLESLKEKLHQLLPNEPIEVHSVQRSIVLRGVVSSAGTMGAALQIANGYLAQIQASTESQMFEQESQSGREDKTVGQIINMMQIGGGQQVMLEVKVAEISRQELKRLNAQFNAMGTDGNWDFGGVNGGGILRDGVFDANALRIPNQGLWGSFVSNSAMFDVALDAARENGLAKILAEPTLTTLTGEQAEFLSGGEFPIPVPRGDNGVTVEFREFGVGLKFLPVVLGSGNINVKLNIAVSELINVNSVAISTQDSTSSFLVPALSKRSASATVELREGQTIAIAGLINENLREVITRFPGLGDLPVLGALFRSQEFVNNETELVILVTPHLAKPIRADKVRLPTDSFVEPSDLEFYLLGRLEGRKSADNASPSGEFSGSVARYGHQIQ